MRVGWRFAQGVAALNDFYADVRHGTRRIVAAGARFKTSLGAEDIAQARLAGPRYVLYVPDPLGRDLLYAIVEDVPGLAADRMIVEVDMDPAGTSGRDKSIEARADRRGRRQQVVIASRLEGEPWHDIGARPTPANSFRSGRSRAQSMRIDRRTGELWFRKADRLGLWRDVGMLDRSIWPAFAGRRVRFVWIRD